MKKIKVLLLALFATLTLQMAHASDTAVEKDQEMSEGEVRKIDKSASKITLRHGEIKNLEMPGMTMVFRVRDPALLENIKAGDKLRFRAEKANGAIFVTAIEPVK
jgi:Cu(I)/Ag(I) efflux system protein CusF